MKGNSMNETKYCPRCENELGEFPALSRVDNKSEVCSDCGLAEALEDFANRDIEIDSTGL